MEVRKMAGKDAMRRKRVERALNYYEARAANLAPAVERAQHSLAKCDPGTPEYAICAGVLSSYQSRADQYDVTLAKLQFILVYIDAGFCLEPLSY
jgi:hypothetical protein